MLIKRVVSKLHCMLNVLEFDLFRFFNSRKFRIFKFSEMTENKQ